MLKQLKKHKMAPYSLSYFTPSRPQEWSSVIKKKHCVFNLGDLD